MLHKFISFIHSKQKISHINLVNSKNSNSNRNLPVFGTLLIFSILFFSIRPAFSNSEAATRGVLGAFPLVSGFYVSSEPAYGVIFTAADIALLLGIFSNKSANQKRSAVPTYTGLLIVFNLLDAYASYSFWKAENSSKELKAHFNWDESRGYQVNFNLDF